MFHTCVPPTAGIPVGKAELPPKPPFVAALFPLIGAGEGASLFQEAGPGRFVVVPTVEFRIGVLHACGFTPEVPSSAGLCMPIGTMEDSKAAHEGRAEALRFICEKRFTPSPPSVPVESPAPPMPLPLKPALSVFGATPKVIKYCRNVATIAAPASQPPEAVADLEIRFRYS